MAKRFVELLGVEDFSDLDVWFEKAASSELAGFVKGMAMGRGMVVV
jgi:hypothetical protein